MAVDARMVPSLAAIGRVLVDVLSLAASVLEKRIRLRGAIAGPMTPAVLPSLIRRASHS